MNTKTQSIFEFHKRTTVSLNFCRVREKGFHWALCKPCDGLVALMSLIFFKSFCFSVSGIPIVVKKIYMPHKPEAILLFYASGMVN